MPWYREGGVAVTAGQTTVVGTGVNFAIGGRVGDAWLGPDGRWYEVTNIASETVLAILPAYQGATVSGGAYALAPLQGYVKESADRLRKTVEQFGGTLALFGNAADIVSLRANIGAATRGSNSDITSLSGLTTPLSVTQGGTGGATKEAARAALGLKSAALADAVGTVSQSGGAIIETGGNANGAYTKWADGTMICTGTLDLGNVASTGATGSMFASTQIAGRPFPALFAGTPACIIQLISGNANTFCGTFGLPTASATQAFYAIAPIAGSQSLAVTYIARGRWF